MQHNANAARVAPPHLRGNAGGAAHHMAMHMNMNSAAIAIAASGIAGQQPPLPQHMTNMNNIGPTPTTPVVQQHQKSLNMPTQAPPLPAVAQQRQQQQNHSNSVAAATHTAQSKVAGTMQQPQQHLREHHNRLVGHQQQQQHSLQTQIHKVRLQQQYLNVNNNNNSNSTNNKSNNVHKNNQHLQKQHNQARLQQAQSYNQQINAPHMQHLQQQHINSVQLQQQQQPQPPAQQRQQRNVLPHQANALQMQSHRTPQLKNHQRPQQQQQQEQEQQQQQQQHVTTAISNSNKSNSGSNNNKTVVKKKPISSHTNLPKQQSYNESNSSNISSSNIQNFFNNYNKNSNHNKMDNQKAPKTATTNNENTQKWIANDLPSYEGVMANSKNDISIPLENDIDEITSSRNSKDKTPMCLVNELARYNKIPHQYRLTSEDGPAHCKRFTVTLKLGNEEYSAEGFKIKKAQHLAASFAIEKTKYKHPLPKLSRRPEERAAARANITPTVELNALAMKLGQQTCYLFDPRQMPPVDIMAPMPTNNGLRSAYRAPAQIHHMITPPPPPPPPPAHAAYMRRNGVPTPLGIPLLPGHKSFGPYPAKFHPSFGMLPPPVDAHGLRLRFGPCRITLVVGKDKYVGIGRTVQQAKHDAAARALQVLKNQVANQTVEELNKTVEEDCESKSPISLVHEIGNKRNLAVHFKVLREDGPAHMKNFITACIVGTLVTEGEGAGKRISKKRAAEKMLQELKKLPPLTRSKSPSKHSKVCITGKDAEPGTMHHGKFHNKNNASGEKRKRVKVPPKETTEIDAAEADDPVTKLLQLQQCRKEKEPVYELISSGKNVNERSRRREFLVEVTAQGMAARGTGSSKKFAKRIAAQNLLSAMGLHNSTEIENSLKTLPTPKPPEISNNANLLSDASIIKAISSADEIVDVPLVSTSAGFVPGTVILRQNKKHASKKKEFQPTATPTAVATVPLDVESIEKTTTKKLEKTTPNKTMPTKTKSNVAVIAKTCPTESNNEIATTAETPAATATVSAIVAVAASTTNSDTSVAITTTNVAATTATTNTTNSNTTAATKATDEPMFDTAATEQKPNVNMHMKQQLLYLARVLNFAVKFDDYPKANHNDCLTVVTFDADPFQICHGVGSTYEESHNDAARKALEIIKELRLNNEKR